MELPSASAGGLKMPVAPPGSRRVLRRPAARARCLEGRGQGSSSALAGSLALTESFEGPWRSGGKLEGLGHAGGDTGGLGVVGVS